MQTVEKVVEVPMVGQTTQGTVREVDVPLAPRREDCCHIFCFCSFSYRIMYTE